MQVRHKLCRVDLVFVLSIFRCSQDTAIRHDTSSEKMQSQRGGGHSRGGHGNNQPRGGRNVEVRWTVTVGSAGLNLLSSPRYLVLEVLLQLIFSA